MKKNHLLYILCCLAFICSCSDTSYEQSGGGAATNAMLNVQLNIPGMSATSATRAATAVEEKQIDTMDALVFDADDKFLYRATFSTMTTVSEATTVTFFVQKTDDPVHIYLLVNAQTKVEAGNFTEGDSYETVMKQLLTDPVPFISGSTTAHKLGTPFPMWGRLELSSIGEGNNDGGTVNMLRSVARIDVGLNYKGDTPETAMASKLDDDNFELKSVYLYVVRDKGYIAPTLDSLNNSYTKAIGPTLQDVGDRVPIDYADANTPTAEVDVTVNPYAIEREMYIYEADGRLISNQYDVTRVVVGGIYKGTGYETNTDISYYTLYLTEQNSSGGFDTYGREILRNHNYRFNITKVTGPGRDLPEPDEPQHMIAKLVEWEAVDETQSFTGQYTIAGEATLWFDKSGEGSLEIFSDNPEPVELLTETMQIGAYNNIPLYDSANEYNWGIHMDYYDDGTGYEYPFKITQDATDTNIYLIEGKAAVNQTDSERGSDNHYFFIKVGDDILKRIYLKQRAEDTELQLSVTQRYLQFSRSGYAPYPATGNTTSDLEIEWEPVGATITITDLDPNKLDTRIHPLATELITSGYTSTIDKAGLTSGYVNLGCYVDSEYPNDVLERQSTTWEVTATYGDQVKTIYVTAERFDYGIDPKLSDVILDGDPYEFPVRANAKWEATISGSSNVTPGNNLSGGVDISFGDVLTIGTVDITTTSGTSTSPELFTVTFTSPEGVYDDVVVSYYGFPAVKVENDGEDKRANSILYNSTRMPLSIPAGKWAAESLSEGGIGSGIIVEKANGVEPTLFSGELVWTDNSSWVGVSPTDLNKAYVFACDNGKETKLYARRGTGDGNMVVALRKDDYTVSTWGNNIVWSWHIWGTDYDPTATGGLTYNTDTNAANQQYWMTRDLGAFAKDWDSSVTSISGSVYYSDPVSGLCYQFGRKDPISQKTMYDAKGAAISRTIIQSSEIDQNVAKTSIVYPKNMMHADFWSGTYIADNVQNSWGGITGQKMIAFDPCPYGYKVSNKVINDIIAMQRWNGTTNFEEVFSSTDAVIGVDTKEFYGGLHPRTGYITYNFANGTGRLMWVADGTRSNATDYWNSTLYMVHWTYNPTGSLNFNSVIRPSSALKVRCVKEQN